MRNVSSKFSYESSTESMPEKSLIAAILNRAVRDLVAIKDRRICAEAVSWFLNPKHYDFNADDDGIYWFPYLVCADALQLSAADRYLLKITALYMRSQLDGQKFDWEDVKEEGKTSGARNCELVKDLIARVQNSSNATILRVERNIRHTRCRPSK